MSAAKWNRKLHRVGAIVTALPVLIIFVSGVVLQLKKDWAWVQPATERGSTQELQLTWDEILASVATVEEAAVTSWDDIDRLDVRPSRGMLKVRCENRWEVQLDAVTGEVLASNYRRSDLIEAIHDGSWFHDSVKLWIFLPSALILCALWVTGMYLWVLPYLVKRRRKKPA